MPSFSRKQLRESIEASLWSPHPFSLHSEWQMQLTCQDLAWATSSWPLGSYQRSWLKSCGRAPTRVWRAHSPQKPLWLRPHFWVFTRERQTSGLTGKLAAAPSGLALAVSTLRPLCCGRRGWHTARGLQWWAPAVCHETISSSAWRGMSSPRNPGPSLYLQGERILLLCPFKELYDFPSEKAIIAASFWIFTLCCAFTCIISLHCHDHLQAKDLYPHLLGEKM